MLPASFADFLPVGLNTHEFSSVANVLTQWCTSWCHQLRGCVQNLGINPRSIIILMCLLDDVVLGVQAPHEELLEEAAARSFLVVLAHEIERHLIMG